MKRLLLFPFVLLAVVVGSFLTIHLLAFLGVFVALAYPVWWLFMPRSTPCLMCNTGRAGTSCLFCHEPIDKTKIHAKTLGSALKNAALLLTLSLVSLGVVFLETRLLYYFGIPATPATVDLVIPAKGQYPVEEIFPVPIELIGIKTPINAVQVDLSFDPRTLQVHQIDTQDSFANIFIQKEINNDQGFARLTGGLPNPGYFSDRGLFATVYFQGIRPGVTQINYLPSSMILANDGRGTNVLKELGEINVLITNERLTQEQRQDQQTVFNTQVLGATSDQEQYTFYAEPQVLGATAQAISPEELTQIRDEVKHNWFLNLLASINDFILRFWQRILQAVTRFR